ncbi:MAG: YkvA family protein [Candidatus Binatia bacterium]
MTFSGRAAFLASGAIGVASRGAAIAAQVRRVSPGRLRQFLGRVELTARFVRDIAYGGYPHVPWKTVSALAAALAYFVAPVDAVPDFLPFTGLLDDAAVLSLVFGAAESDLRRYCAWRGVDPQPYFDEASDAGAA